MLKSSTSRRAVPRFVPPPPPGARAAEGRGATRGTPAAAAAAERIRVVIRNAQRKLLASKRKIQESVDAARAKLTSPR
ncbi:MAG TPA: hypothetical protein VFN39_04545 [Gemmatimonadaceae bacterium]|nr:hypothetical protein [Gemmatimonadaceae bacterium]